MNRLRLSALKHLTHLKLLTCGNNHHEIAGLLYSNRTFATGEFCPWRILPP